MSRITLSACVRCAMLSACLFSVERASAQNVQDRREETLLEDEVGPRYYIWKNEDTPGQFAPTGFMPDGMGLSQSTSESDTPHSEPHCLRLYCQLSEKPWVGIYFLHEGEWEPREAVNLFDELKAEKGDPVVCRFWARSRDGASVQFKVGGVTKGNVKDSLTFPVPSKWIELGSEWKMYELDMTGKDMRSLVGGFTWACDRAHNRNADITFDLDDIYFVRLKPTRRS